MYKRRLVKNVYEITPEDEKKLAKLSTYQQAILRLLAEVPKGKVTTYGDLAKELARRNPNRNKKLNALRWVLQNHV